MRSFGPRRWLVRCAGYPRCKFMSHRNADEKADAEKAPCPRCKLAVVADA